MHVMCPGCSEKRDVGADVQVGDMVSCDACAGVVFRLIQHHDAYVLREVPQASCPVCGTMLRLADDVQAEATVDHCDLTFVVTYAYGAYALEHSN